MKSNFIFLILFFLSIQLKAQNLKFVNQSNFGFLLGENAKAVFSAQNFSGLNFKKYQTDLGLVAGFDDYQSVKIIPIAFGAKYNLKPLSKVNPYLFLATGYGFGFNNDKDNSISHEGGFLFNPNVGLKFNNTGKVGYHLLIGYKTQKAIIKNSYNLAYYGLTTGGTSENTYAESYVFKKVVLSLGLSF